MCVQEGLARQQQNLWVNQFHISSLETHRKIFSACYASSMKGAALTLCICSMQTHGLQTLKKFLALWIVQKHLVSATCIVPATNQMLYICPNSPLDLLVLSKVFFFSFGSLIFTNPSSLDQQSTMSTASKVKLPSIAELTNNLHLPKSSLDALPLLLIFRAPVPAARQLPLAQLDQRVAAPPAAVPYHLQTGPQPANPQHYHHYSHANVPPPPGYYQPSYYHPAYYLPVVTPANANYVHLPQEAKPYSVPEVINKPMNKCHRCGTTETPEWRRGPNGLRTLCNACGLFHAKLVKRKGAVLAAEEVLNNKVCKGKNGRRVSIKKQALDESKKRMREAQVTEIPPIPYTAPPVVGAPQHHPSMAGPQPPLPQVPLPSVPGTEYLYHVQPEMGSMPLPGLAQWGHRMALPRPVLNSPYQSLPPLRN